MGANNGSGQWIDDMDGNDTRDHHDGMNHTGSEQTLSICAVSVMSKRWVDRTGQIWAKTKGTKRLGR